MIAYLDEDKDGFHVVTAVVKIVSSGLLRNKNEYGKAYVAYGCESEKEAIEAAGRAGYKIVSGEVPDFN